MGLFSNRKDTKRAAIREFIFDTVRKLDGIVTRSKFERFVNLPHGGRIIYAYLYGISVYTWSVRETNMRFKDFAEIFEIIDTALDEVGIHIQPHLDINRDFDKIESVFNDIYLDSISGGLSFEKEKALLTSNNPDYQIIGSHYANAFSKNDMELAKAYIAKVISVIEDEPGVEWIKDNNKSSYENESNTVSSQVSPQVEQSENIHHKSSKMKTFKVYYKESDGYKAVKVGASYPAFFLGWIWFLYKRAYSLGFWFLLFWIWYLLKSSAYIHVEDYTDAEILIDIIGLAGFFLASFKGNAWVAKYYEKNNYIHIATIQADNPKAAIALAEKDNKGGYTKPGKSNNASDTILILIVVALVAAIIININ